MNQEEIWLLNEKHAGVTSDAFYRDCEQLRQGEPLAYIINTIPFRGVTIHLDSHPLIPRTETEYWVGAMITRIRERSSDTPISVLDLCAGSGCIGVAVLAEVEKAHVDFIEIDTQHHPTIKKNIIENTIDIHRTSIRGGDLLEQADVYDYILTNPPYIDPLLNRTESSVTDFEPHNALYGGKSGMELILKIISEAHTHLKHDGIVCIEHEPEQVEAIREAGTTHGYHIETLPDQYGILRYTILTRHSDDTVSQ